MHFHTGIKYVQKRKEKSYPKPEKTHNKFREQK